MFNSILPWGITIPIAALAMVCIIVWLTQRAQQTRTAAQRDVQLALLQKFSSGEELMRFLETEGGKVLIERLSADGEPADPRKKTIKTLTSGLVLIFLGGGFWLLATKIPVFLIPGVICVAIGIGLLIASAVAHRVAKKIGLIPTGETK